MQIAKLFASLGFQVDTTGLVTFKKAISDARHELTNLNQGGKNSTNQLRNLRKEVDKLSTSMGKIKAAGGAGNGVGKGYTDMAGAAHKLNNSLGNLSTNRKKYTEAIGKINASVHAGLPHWQAYRKSIVQARIALRNLNRDLAQLRAGSSINVRVNHGGGARGGAGGAGGAGGGGGGGARGGGFAGGAVGSLLGSILPSAALGGGLGSIGYAGAAMVKAARDQTRMESSILMTSKTQEEYARTLGYVRGEAERLGLSSTELGKSYAQISMSAGNMQTSKKEEMFTGFSEFMMSMGTSTDDQQGIFRAINQMFGFGRILQQEINQLSERGIPATLIYQAAMKTTGAKSIAEVKKIQEDGKLDPEAVLYEMSRMVQELAHDSGAYAKMMESSITKQGQMMERMRTTSQRIMDSGLDVQLGKIFGLLEVLIEKIESLVVLLTEAKDGFLVVKDALESVVGKGGILSAVLFLLLFRFKGVSLAGRRAFAVLANGGLKTRALSVLVTGLGLAIRKTILRLGLWGVALYAVGEAISWLHKQVDIGDNGGWSWFDATFAGAERLWLQIKLLDLEYGLFMRNVGKAMMNPFDYKFGERMREPILRYTNDENNRLQDYINNSSGALGASAAQQVFENQSYAQPQQGIVDKYNNKNNYVTSPIVINNMDGSQTKSSVTTQAMMGNP